MTIPHDAFRERRRRRAVMLSLLAALLLLVACSSVENYPDLAGPVYAGDYAAAAPEFDGEIHVMSWNIKYAEHVDEAIAEVRASAELPQADIILLQEMDAAGVERMAQALGYNYVYFPASIHTHHERDFGNAILSRWPLQDPSKVVLPFKNPKNDQIRIAARAVALIDGIEVLVYSVHTETYWMIPSQRRAQIEALLANVAPAYDYVVIGGDFNTIFPLDIPKLVQKFEDAGFVWATEDVGHTVDAAGVRFTLDFIFAKGMKALASGKLGRTEASDHLPIWAVLALIE